MTIEESEHSLSRCYPRQNDRLWLGDRLASRLRPVDSRQVMRDLLDAPESEWKSGASQGGDGGLGARLLWYEDEDGQWAGGAFLPSGFDFREWQEVG